MRRRLRTCTLVRRSARAGTRVWVCQQSRSPEFQGDAREASSRSANGARWSGSASARDGGEGLKGQRAMQNTTTAILQQPPRLRRLLVGSTSEGEHVELTFSGRGGWVEVGGKVTCRSESGADRDIAKLVDAFNDACRIPQDLSPASRARAPSWR